MPSISVLKFETGVKQEDSVENTPFKREVVTPSAEEESNGETNTGRWSNPEHKIFVEQLQLVGKDWRRIAEQIKTRSAVQVRTHAQKYFLKLKNAYTRKNKFLSEEENQVLNKFVLGCANSDDDDCDSSESNATIKEPTLNLNLKRKRTDLSEIFPVRRRALSPGESKMKLQDKLSVAIKPVAHQFCEEPDALDLLQIQTLASKDSDFELNFFEPDFSEATDLIRPFIREPVWPYYGAESFKKLEPCGRSESVDTLADEECLDLLCVL